VVTPATSAISRSVTRFIRFTVKAPRGCRKAFSRRARIPAGAAPPGAGGHL